MIREAKTIAIQERFKHSNKSLKGAHAGSFVAVQGN
jgi:hypothetical protein